MPDRQIKLQPESVMADVCLGVTVAIHPSRNGAHYRIYVKGRLSWRPLSCKAFHDSTSVQRGPVVPSRGRRMVPRSWR